MTIPQFKNIWDKTKEVHGREFGIWRLTEESRAGATAARNVEHVHCTEAIMRLMTLQIEMVS